MEKIYMAKVWDEVAFFILLLICVFVVSVGLLWMQGTSWNDITKIIFMELALLVLVISVKLLLYSQQVTLSKDSLTNVYRGGLLLKIQKRIVEWKDIRRGSRKPLFF